jgi:hypothetical protein
MPLKQKKLEICFYMQNKISRIALWKHDTYLFHILLFLWLCKQICKCYKSALVITYSEILKGRKFWVYPPLVQKKKYNEVIILYLLFNYNARNLKWKLLFSFSFQYENHIWMNADLKSKKYFIVNCLGRYIK